MTILRRLNRPVSLLAAVALVACSTQVPAEEPESAASETSPDYAKVDASFSSVAIDTPFPEVEDRLTIIAVDGCEEWGECEYRDAAGVRHYFYAFDSAPENNLMVIKIVEASDFEGREIAALEIGSAREKEAVLANIRAFLPGIEIDCGREASGNVGPDECGGDVGPGWFQIGFDESGQLQAVRFDGYHFT